MHPGCLLLAVRFSLNLDMYILGEFAIGLVVSGTAVCIRLLWPSGTLFPNIIACLGQLGELSNYWLGCYANEVYFGWSI